MPSWTTTDIPDQSGRVAVVTGANSGLGLNTALELARKGAHVVVACRNQEKGAAALERVRAEAPAGHAELRRLDLADLASVRAFAAAVGDGLDRVDLLVNNAGIMGIPRRTTADGFEMQFGTNHLGHFALTGLLLPALLRSSAPRVVTVSSGAHRMGRIAFHDLQGERRYWRWSAYGQSKLANLLFAFELQRRAAAAGTTLLSVAAHPGYAATNLQSASARMDRIPIEGLLMKVSNALIAQSDDKGALPLLYAATMDVPPAAYVGPDGWKEMRGYPTLVQPAGHATDEDTARRLWEVSEELTGVRYAFTGLSAPAHTGG
jgi:NAD(P)-dependent dehydrogenase (short-subunit alcohol dehydrogenase family)